MDRTEQIRIAKRLLAMIEHGTAESAPSQHKVPVARYSDPDLWEREVQAFYKQ